MHVCLGIQILFSAALIKTENGSRVDEQTGEVIRGKATVLILTLKVLKIKAGFYTFLASFVSMYCVYVHIKATGGITGRVSGSYLCVSEKGTMQGMPSQLALRRATMLFIALHSSKKAKRSLPPSLRTCLSLHSHCILWSVLLFKCSYSPFRRRVTFKPTVTMATRICIWKSAFEGGQRNLQQYALALCSIWCAHKKKAYEKWDNVYLFIFFSNQHWFSFLDSWLVSLVTWIVHAKWIVSIKTEWLLSQESHIDLFLIKYAAVTEVWCLSCQ